MEEEKFRYVDVAAEVEQSATNIAPAEPAVALPARETNFHPGSWRHRHQWTLLIIALTLAAGFIRFFHLDYPCLWGDEALVYWRVCGTYAQMLVPLHEDGFTPLHYEANWVLTQLLRFPSTLPHHPSLARLFPSLARLPLYLPTPFWLRLIPAISGTLMVPAVYFLGRQMLPRRTAALAAGFTVCSAFLIIHSRDAKMYMDCWLMITLHAACALWWMRTRRLTPWLCWVASGSAAAGLHASALVVTGVCLVFLLTQPRLHWKMVVPFLVGVALIAAGPVGYYKKFNQWDKKIEDKGWQSGSGLGWIDIYNYDRDGSELLKYTATTYLMGWEWPHTYNNRTPDEPWIHRFKILSVLIIIILFTGMLPWPIRWRSRSLDDPPPVEYWRAGLWTGAWIVLPLYGCYCRSMHDFSSPVDVWDSLTGGLGVWAMPVGIGLIVTFFVATGYFDFTRRWAGRTIAWAGVAAVLLMVCAGIYHGAVQASKTAAQAGTPWHSVWVPRYLGFVWPALVIIAAALLARLPTRPVRAVAVVFVLGVNLAIGSARIFGHTEPPTDRMAADVWLAQDPRAGVETWMRFSYGMEGPGSGNILTVSGKYYLEMLAKRPMSPVLFKKSLEDYKIDTGGWDLSILSAVHRQPGLSKLIVWDQVFPLNRNSRWGGTASQPDADTLLPKLPGWRLVSKETYPVRQNWNWFDMGAYRRWEYERTNG